MLTCILSSEIIYNFNYYIDLLIFEPNMSHGLKILIETSSSPMTSIIFLTFIFHIFIFGAFLFIYIFVLDFCSFITF